MADRVLGLLGIARRASALSLGHDAAKSSVLSGNARLCLLSADASERLKEEFSAACGQAKRKMQIRHIPYSMDEIGKCSGAARTAVLTVNDTGLAHKIIQLVQEGH